MTLIINYYNSTDATRARGGDRLGLFDGAYSTATDHRLPPEPQPVQKLA